MKISIPFLSWMRRAALEIEVSDVVEARSQLKIALELSVKGGANLGGANLYGADLRGADLRGANLSGANLGGVDLRGANLYGADLGGADLGGANLYGADLSGANLSGADLGGANLSGANLSGANLGGANLSGADLYGAKISHILASCSRILEPYQFMLWCMEDGSAQLTAGCRGPWTIARYREHVAQSYSGTAKAAETLCILDFFEATASVTE